ncbi:MAG: hypothetical protein ACE5R6_11200 [Candidatus Heimdallarchaeota archaeon]
MGEPRERHISSIIGIMYILVITYLFVSKIELNITKTDLLLIGVFWLIISIIFEFGFGHYIIGHPWSKAIS